MKARTETKPEREPVRRRAKGGEDSPPAGRGNPFASPATTRKAGTGTARHGNLEVTVTIHPDDPPPPLVIMDGLTDRISFSVVTAADGAGGYEVEGGRVSGAVAVFSEYPDLEAEEIVSAACAAAARVLGVSPREVAVRELVYAGGQALHAAGKCGAVLRLAELWGREWPTAGCLATLLGYPLWLTRAAVNEYRRQRA